MRQARPERRFGQKGKRKMENGNRIENRSAEKKEIREMMLRRRGELTEEQRRTAALLLTERILGHQWFYRSDILLGYAAYGSEIETMEILQEALRRGKRVYLPRVLTGQEEQYTGTPEIERDRKEQQAGMPGIERDWKEQQAAAPGVVSGCKCRSQKIRRMEFYRIDSLSELQPGYRGIPEPPRTGERYVFRDGEEDRVLMLMPGVAFDPYRNRLGYGGGFYDRYLADQEKLQLRTIGVGFRCQMAELLPAEESDVKPYQVICV